MSASHDAVDRASLTSPEHRFVSNDDASCRMFEADWMESLSHVRPWVPHLVFVPAIVAALVTALRADSPGRVVALVCGGLLFWTVTEYVIHRYFFHPPSRPRSALEMRSSPRSPPGVTSSTSSSTGSITTTPTTPRAWSCRRR